MCYKLFKRRNVLYTSSIPFIDSRGGYYNFKNKNINFDQTNKNNILGIKDVNNGDYEILSIPFKIYNNKIVSVYINNGGINIIRKVISEIKNKEYVNLDDAVRLFFEKHSFIDYLTVNNRIKIN